MVTGKKVPEEAFVLNEGPENLPRKVEQFFLFSKMLNAHSMIPHTPNCEKWAFHDLFPRTFLQ